MTDHPVSTGRVAGLHRLTLRVPDLRAAGEFYRDTWGARLIGAGERRWDLRCRDAVHCDLSLAPGSPTGMESLALRVNDAGQLGRVLDRAGQAGATEITPPTRSPIRDDETTATFRDPDGNLIELVAWHGEDRRPAGDGPDFGPRKLGHVVLWTPHIDAMESFYAVLGLRVTDRTAMGMSFLRCGADHHSLALVKHAEKTGLQHAAFDVGTIDAVMREKGRLTAAGHECLWGPGRHGPGNNVFSYYRDPAGNIVEFYGDLQQFPEDEPFGEPVYWGPEHKGDIWGVAGPAPLAFRS